MSRLLHLLRTHWKLVLLVLIVLLLLPAVVAALMAAEDEPQIAVPAPPTTDESSQPLIEGGDVLRPLAEYQEMIERPLFNANRRPLEEEEVADSGESSPDE